MRALAVLVLLCGLARGDAETEVLRRYGVVPTRKDISRYLRTLYPDRSMLKIVGELVARLGSEQPRQRAEAARGLARFGAAAIAALEGAAKDPDPEVARRGRRLLLQARSYLKPELLYAAFKTIERREMKGLVEEVVHTIPLSGERFVRNAGRRALESTARKKDVPRLRELTRGSAGSVRVPAVHALARVAGRDARGDLVALLADKTDLVSAVAAWELADMHDRACFPALSALLSSKDIDARLTVWRALRAISGMRFGYAPYETTGARRVPAAKWRAWIEQHSATVQWTLPLAAASSARGRYLISTGGRNRVVELSEDGTKLWEVPAVNPWCCFGARNGHRLVTHFDKSIVIEYDDAGREVRRIKLPGKACSVQRLGTGNILVAIGSVGAVFEYTPAGEVAWELRLKGRPFFAQRLPNGKTLVSLHDTGRVVEVDRSKQQVERFKGLRGPYSVHRLENGNWLVCLPGAGRVVELTPTGKEVWSVGGLGWPASAHRLESGATVIAHRGGVEKFFPGGQRRMVLKVSSGSVFVSRN